MKNMNNKLLFPVIVGVLLCGCMPAQQGEGGGSGSEELYLQDPTPDMARLELNGGMVDSLIFYDKETYYSSRNDTIVFDDDYCEMIKNKDVKRDLSDRLVFRGAKTNYGYSGNCEFNSHEEDAYSYEGNSWHPTFYERTESILNGNVKSLTHYIYDGRGLPEMMICYCDAKGCGVEMGCVSPYRFYSVKYYEYTYLEFDDYGNWIKRDAAIYSMRLPEDAELSESYRLLFDKKTSADTRAELEQELLQKLKSNAVKKGEEISSYTRTEQRKITYK